ncbi:hypothetical protein SSX86_007536 [Deinandra increscens subsp. villosa]|uniref:Integrase catalytic domain-containing protein n=1 Tax=Deinandra increscens subsp. villosa TaxID=3103831 RepID=A0AAP0H670_9ASTR
MLSLLIIDVGFADALAGEHNRPAEIEEDDWYGILAKAHSAIILSLGDKVLREVSKESTAAGIWLKLESLYMTKSLANRLYLKKKLYTFQMDSGKSIEEHSDEFNKLILGLENIDVHVEDEDQAILFLTSLPPAYEHFVETLMYGRDYISIGEVMSALNSRELKKKHEVKEGADGLFFEKHLEKDCPNRNKSRDDSSSGKGASYNTDVESEGYESVDVLVVTSGKSEHEWILDSGCSYHMTPLKSCFKDFKEVKKGTVQLGDDRPCEIMGIGSMVLRLGNGTELELHDVRFIPKLRRSLISLGTLEKEGYHVSLKNGKAKNKNRMKLLSGIGDLGISAIKGKSHRVKFGRRTHVTQGILDYVHADLWGPAKTQSIGGALYFLAIIDDYSRTLWAYALKSKDEAFYKIREWKVQFCKENGIGRHKIVAYTPQQNGLVERMNRTLLNKVRSPSTAIEMITPMEKWSGSKPDLSNLRRFGAIAYAHINSGKLEPRAQKCIMLGYSEGVKGYRLWRLGSGSPKVIVSRGVTFNEELMYKDVLEVADTEEGGDGIG